ncbi:MAG: hypothetical protein AAF997_07510 [Myxococcota bacterium]
MRIVATLFVMTLGCGSGAPGELGQPASRSFRAGDRDAYGCPFVDPVPWLGEALHEEACGPDCTPVENSDDFIACLSPDIPRHPDGAISLMTVPLNHPVSGETYRFSDPGDAWPFFHLCWRFPSSGEPLYPTECLRVPDECFEEPVTAAPCG